MAIIIVHFVANGECDSSNENILQLLGYIPEAEGKEVSGEIYRFQINNIPAPLTDGRIYLINDESIISSDLYIVLEKALHQYVGTETHPPQELTDGITDASVVDLTDTVIRPAC